MGRSGYEEAGGFKDMLKQLRQKRVMKKVLWGLALIIIPAFVLWGAGGLREKARYAGEIFGEKVSFEEYRESYDAVRNAALLVHGSDFYDMQEELGLDKAAWDRLIMLKEAERMRIKVSDEDVVARVASMPIFRTEEGLFSPRNYAMIVRGTLRTDPRKFEEQIRQSLKIERMLIRTLGSTDISVSEEEIDAALKKEKEEKAKEEALKEEAEKEEREGQEAAEPEEAEEEADEEEKEETLREKRERARNAVIIAKRMEAYQRWHAELVKKAGLKSNIATASDKEEAEDTGEIEETEGMGEPAEKTAEEGPESTPGE
jgi:hypothetical protein